MYACRAHRAGLAGLVDAIYDISMCSFTNALYNVSWYVLVMAAHDIKHVAGIPVPGYNINIFPVLSVNTSSNCAVLLIHAKLVQT